MPIESFSILGPQNMKLKIFLLPLIFNLKVLATLACMCEDSFAPNPKLYFEIVYFWIHYFDHFLTQVICSLKADLIVEIARSITDGSELIVLKTEHRGVYHTHCQGHQGHESFQLLLLARVQCKFLFSFWVLKFHGESTIKILRAHNNKNLVLEYFDLFITFKCP